MQMNPKIQYIVNPNGMKSFSLNFENSYHKPKISTKFRLREARFKGNAFFKKKEFKVECKNRNNKGRSIKGHITFNMIYCRKGSFSFYNFGNISKKYIKRPFLLSETEVTEKLYEAIINPQKIQDEKNSSDKAKGGVSLYEAIYFCNELSKSQGLTPYYNTYWFYSEDDIHASSNPIGINPKSNGFRLPTLEEWQYAAKAGTDNKYAGCNQIDNLKTYAWYGEGMSHLGLTYPVGRKLPNEWGFYDMNGNVSEYCYHVDKLNGTDVSFVCGGSTHSESKDIGNNYQRMAISHSKYSSFGIRIAKNID